VDLAPLLRNVREMLKHPAMDRQVRVKIHLKEALPKIPGDTRSLERAFTAILDNALKLSQPGGTVQIRGGSLEDRVWVEVADTGVRIPRNALPHVFDRFFRIDEFDRRIPPGVGLGLSIARQVIEQHNGTILVSSDANEGNCIRVELPVRFPEI
jgi:signal transduction histidine kinase